MNFIFISPNFPHTYWQFCDRLKKAGANVLGIGDCPYDNLDYELKCALTEYYKVDSMENYDSMYRAVAFFAFQNRCLSLRTTLYNTFSGTETIIAKR